MNRQEMRTRIRRAAAAFADELADIIEESAKAPGPRKPRSAKVEASEEAMQEARSMMRRRKLG